MSAELVALAILIMMSPFFAQHVLTGLVAGDPKLRGATSNGDADDDNSTMIGLKPPRMKKNSRISNAAFVKIRIRDSECYSAPTESSFTLHLVALDFNDRFLSSVKLSSSRFRYDYLTSTHIYEDFLKSEIIDDQTLDSCFDEGRPDCVPRADAVLITFHSQPNDPWTIDQIDVDVLFVLGSYQEDWHKWHFEHAVLLPCISWMKGTHTYQIGPRIGLFIEHDYVYSPQIGETMREWV